MLTRIFTKDYLSESLANYKQDESEILEFF